MNTRRLACEPSGVFMSVFSLVFVRAVKPSVSAAPPVLPPSVPAAAGSLVARRKRSTFWVPLMGQES